MNGIKLSPAISAGNVSAIAVRSECHNFKMVH